VKAMCVFDADVYSGFLAKQHFGMSIKLTRCDRCRISMIIVILKDE